jgi:hypothetical protein
MDNSVVLDIAIESTKKAIEQNLWILRNRSARKTQDLLANFIIEKISELNNYISIAEKHKATGEKQWSTDSFPKALSLSLHSDLKPISVKD